MIGEYFDPLDDEELKYLTKFSGGFYYNSILNLSNKQIKEICENLLLTRKQKNIRVRTKFSHLHIGENFIYFGDKMIYLEIHTLTDQVFIMKRLLFQGEIEIDNWPGKINNNMIRKTDCCHNWFEKYDTNNVLRKVKFNRLKEIWLKDFYKPEGLYVQLSDKYF